MDLLSTKRGHGEGWKCLDASKLQSEQQRHTITVAVFSNYQQHQQLQIWMCVTRVPKHCFCNTQQFLDIENPFFSTKESRWMYLTWQYYKKQLGQKCSSMRNSGRALTSPLVFHHPWEKTSPLRLGGSYGADWGSFQGSSQIWWETLEKLTYVKLSNILTSLAKLKLSLMC